MTKQLDYDHPTKKDMENFGSQPTLGSATSSDEEEWPSNNNTSIEVLHSTNYASEIAFGADDEQTSKVVEKSEGKVYFIRHGESTANEANIYSGVTDVMLTKFGIKQAQAAGMDMKQKKITNFDTVYTSHLIRTRKTAAVALHTAGLIPNDNPDRMQEWPSQYRLVGKPALAERSFGIFTGENKVLLRRALGHEEFENMVHSPHEAPPCAETIGSIYQRCQEFHQAYIVPRLARGEQVLVVAHQYVLEAYALVLEGLSPTDYYSFSLPNGKALSAQDMKAYRYKTTSEWQKKVDEVGDKTILHGTKAAAFLFLTGMILRTLPSTWGSPVTSVVFEPIFQAIITICLAVSSWFVYLEIDLSNAVANTPKFESVLVCSTYLIRIVVLAVGGLLFLRDHDVRDDMKESLQWWMLLFAVPPALTTPTISLTWGGKVYLTAIWSSLLSAVCGFALAGIALSPLIGLDIVALVPFIIVVLVALFLPAVAAQGYRYWKPIDSKRYSKKWKFLGVVAFGIMGLAAGLHLTPASLFSDMFSEEALIGGRSYNCIRQFQIAFLVYFVMRFTAFAAARMAVIWNRLPSSSPLQEASKDVISVDVFILLSQHNIFLWIALASGFREHDDTGGAGIYTSFWATALFFLLPAIEESTLVSFLAKRLLRTALSRIQVQSKREELNAVWKATATSYFTVGEATEFFEN